MNGQAKTLMPSKSVRNVKARTGIKREKLTQKRLKEVLHYDLVTGVFTWRLSLSPGVYAGSVAGTIRYDGYREIQIDRVLYKAHRLAILYVDGYFPENEVDHKNRSRDDNIYENLRESTRVCQSRNRSVSRNSSSGVTGLHWYRNKKWLVKIGVNRKCVHVGYFDDKLEAAFHRFAAEQCLGYQDCDINSSAKKFIDLEMSWK